MKIAIVGSRGIPNRYGGFEAFAENLSYRLMEKGHEVSVYCRRPFTRPEDDQLIDPRIRRVILPTIAAKHLDTLIHTFLAVLHVAFTDAEVVLMVNVANSPVAWIPRLFGKPVVLNVDGLDRQRRKWGWLAQTYLGFCEWLSVYTPTRIVTDAETVRSYYRSRYDKDSTMIGYGAQVPPHLLAAKQSVKDGSVLARFGLKPQGYILYVSRLEPENNPEVLLRAYRTVRTDLPLVVVGNNAYAAAYEKSVHALADPRVIFTGAIYGDGYWELQQNAAFFVFACEVGGIHPALVETMVAGNASLYLDTESNRETAADCGLAFAHNENDLAAKMQQLISDPVLRRQLGEAGAQRARQLYGWEEVTQKYETLFRELRPAQGSR